MEHSLNVRSRKKPKTFPKLDILNVQKTLELNGNVCKTFLEHHFVSWDLPKSAHGPKSTVPPTDQLSEVCLEL